MAGKAGRGSDQFVVRLPDGMRDQLKAEAEANQRSMNAEIVARLEESFHPPERNLYLRLEILPQGTENLDVSLAEFLRSFSSTLRTTAAESKQRRKLEKKPRHSGSI
jgi:hypothetical protein